MRFLARRMVRHHSITCRDGRRGCKPGRHAAPAENGSRPEPVARTLASLPRRGRSDCFATTRAETDHRRGGHGRSKSSSKIRSSIRLSTSRRAIFGSTTRESPTRPSPAGGRAPTSFPSPSRRRRARSSASSTRNGRKTASNRTNWSTTCGGAFGLWARGGLRRRHPDDRPADRVLDRSGPRKAAVLLPE